jgi:hypothetical protein
MELKHFNELNTMKRTLLLSFALMLSLVAYQNASSNNLPTFSRILGGIWSWKKTTHDFGKVEQGKPVTATFEFTNTGEIPIIITNVGVTCGCTTPEYSKDPVAPGQKGFVKAQYNAAASGTFSKTITVTANTDAPMELKIIGEVAVAKQ